VLVLERRLARMKVRARAKREARKRRRVARDVAMLAADTADAVIQGKI